MSEKKRVAFVVTEATIKAVALDWFLRGFRTSGYGAHGESKLKNSKAFAKLLEVEFDRVWAEHRTIVAPVPGAAYPRSAKVTVTRATPSPSKPAK